jgi:DNA-damage-inducible protein D
MASIEFDQVMVALDGAKRISEFNTEYWMGRDIQGILGYEKWDNFRKVIEKAAQACEATGTAAKYHILDVGKMITAGKGAQIQREDCFLTRYGCYLVAMNGDPTKQEVASAQRYFAIQTRRQELSDISLNDEKRLELRGRVKEAVKGLNMAAKASGVRRYDIFHNAGYTGLYGMGLSKIKAEKGIPQNEDLLDRSGRAELAANEFRLTQTEEKLKKEPTRSGYRATQIHHDVGRKVRQTIKDIGGTMPEKLPAEPSIKRIGQKAAKPLPPLIK